jgi:hypothetical protein
MNMKYLTRATIDKGFHAQFTSGATSTDHDAACFFMTMQDRGVGIAEIASYIAIGEQVEPAEYWKEIRRIAATFTVSKEQAA